MHPRPFHFVAVFLLLLLISVSALLVVAPVPAVHAQSSAGYLLATTYNRNDNDSLVQVNTANGEIFAKHSLGADSSEIYQFMTLNTHKKRVYLVGQQKESDTWILDIFDAETLKQMTNTVYLQLGRGAEIFDIDFDQKFERLLVVTTSNMTKGEEAEPAATVQFVISEINIRTGARKDLAPILLPTAKTAARTAAAAPKAAAIVPCASAFDSQRQIYVIAIDTDEFVNNHYYVLVELPQQPEQHASIVKKLYNVPQHLIGAALDSNAGQAANSLLLHGIYDAKNTMGSLDLSNGRFFTHEARLGSFGPFVREICSFAFDPFQGIFYGNFRKNQEMALFKIDMHALRMSKVPFFDHVALMTFAGA